MTIAQFKFAEVSPAAPGTVASSVVVQNSANWAPAGVAAPLDDFIAMNVLAIVQGGTGGTLDIYGQISLNEGADWHDIFHLPQLANGAAITRYAFALGTQTDAITTVGVNLNPALAANTLAFGAWSSRLRLVFVAGSGTSAGTNQNIWLQPQRPYYTRQS